MQKETKIFRYILAFWLNFPLQAAPVNDLGIFKKVPQQWAQLLHFSENSPSSLPESKTGPFYLSPGAIPQDEWQAFGEALARSPQATRCRFPARWWQYALQTGGQPSLAALADCADLQAWLRPLPNRHIALVFAGAYMGNPSSLFGHTFLVVSNRRPFGAAATVIDFAGEVDADVGALSYISRGIGGGFRGHYTLQPFSAKWFDYAVREGRPLEIYPLAWRSSEIDLLWLHLWELRQADFDYAFFRQNCSYRILALLAAIRPELEFRPDFPRVTLPGDTVHWLANRNQLSEPEAVPALSQLAERRAPSDHIDLRLARHYNFRPGRVRPGRDRQDKEADWRELAQTVIAQPATTGPHHNVLAAHGPSRWVIGMTGGQTRTTGLAVGWRAGYHDGLDPPEGFLAGTAIELLGVKLSVQDKRVALDALTLLHLQSSPSNSLAEDRSAWELGWSRERRLQADRSRRLQSALRLGYGLSRQTSSWGWRAAVALEARDRPYLSLRGVAGLDLEMAWHHAAFNSLLRLRHDLLGDRQSRLEWGNSWAMNRDNALRLELYGESNGAAYTPYWRAGWAHYYR
ncbi:DUF4105 domain-containing protein [Chitinimonas arctica]|uniref:DUF4105 domain-containing protein n=1 Tax=Chitinimonas arctica TaxID=2594795 RepID=A0A516SLS6_9NEIS|nr:DUF4105 domain-containing protein [Chitinimonas arctica]QDQ29111.1 DUF4105 domain-containing protein [Chitinimonas arctica]